MNKQEFAKVVQAWANGETIQCCGPNRKWEDLDDCDYPEWEAVTEFEASYRIKPKTKVVYTEVYYDKVRSDLLMTITTKTKLPNNNLKITLEGDNVINMEFLK